MLRRLVNETSAGLSHVDECCFYDVLIILFHSFVLEFVFVMTNDCAAGINVQKQFPKVCRKH